MAVVEATSDSRVRCVQNNTWDAEAGERMAWVESLPVVRIPSRDVHPTSMPFSLRCEKVMLLRTTCNP